MLKTTWLIGASSLIVACTGNTTTEVSDPGVPTQYNVTENGVVQSTIDPHGGTGEEASPTASPGWLQLGLGPQQRHVYLPRGASAPDLSIYRFGRSDIQYPGKSTRVGVELTGLDWHAGDSLQIVSPNVGLSIHDLDTHFAYPRVGSTAVTGQSFDWANAGSPLIDSQKGDTTWVAQMSSVPATAGSQYSVLTRAGVASHFTLSDGQPATLAATLAPVAQDRTLAFHWKGSAFAALAAQAGPNARPAPAPALSIRALPETVARNNSNFYTYYMYLPSLVDFGPVRGTEDFDQTITYGDPFPTKDVKWTEFVTMLYAIPVVVPHVGATHAMVMQAVPVDALAGGVLAPALSPVRDVKINGESLDAPRIGVGHSPTLAWAPPATGTSTNYAVTIQAIVKTGAGFSMLPAGTFYTRSTSLVLPDFATKDVSSYVLTITAIAMADRDLGSRPFVGTLPYASTDYVTAQITP